MVSLYWLHLCSDDADSGSTSVLVISNPLKVMPLTCIHEVCNSTIDRVTGYLDWSSSWFYSFAPGQGNKLDNSHVLQHICPFINYTSFRLFIVSIVKASLNIQHEECRYASVVPQNWNTLLALILISNWSKLFTGLHPFLGQCEPKTTTESKWALRMLRSLPQYYGCEIELSCYSGHGSKVHLIAAVGMLEGVKTALSCYCNCCVDSPTFTDS
jgi:hypothetical protein